MENSGDQRERGAVKGGGGGGGGGVKVRLRRSNQRFPLSPTGRDLGASRDRKGPKVTAQTLASSCPCDGRLSHEIMRRALTRSSVHDRDPRDEEANYKL